ncbi:MAG: periplasmic heavy metal sensor [Ignavibacteria bacterium]|nr:periplasmic heavy metal sensor [Ignavibacteria bacterium]
MKKIFVLVLAVLMTSAFAQQGQGWGRGHGMMLRKLDLTKEQLAKIEDLRTAHQKNMIDLRADLKKLQISKRDMLEKGNLDRKDFLALEEKITKAQGNIRLAMANHKMDVYGILTAEQKDKLAKMTSNFLEARGNGPHGRAINREHRLSRNYDCPFNK